MQNPIQANRDLMRKEEAAEDCAGQDRGQLVAAAKATAEASGDFGTGLEVVVDLLELLRDELADGQ